MGENVILPARSQARTRTSAGGGVRLGFLGSKKSPIGLIDSAMPWKTHPMAVGMMTAGVARYRRRHRRKSCCGDYNPAHVESGRLQGFPVEGAFASAMTAPARRYGEVRDSISPVCFCASKACSNSAGGRYPSAECSRCWL